MLFLAYNFKINWKEKVHAKIYYWKKFLSFTYKKYKYVHIQQVFVLKQFFDITGVRAPFLQIGWNRQFLMMSEFGFVYDSSIVAPFSDPPLWPYTLDYRPPHACVYAEQSCPTRSYPNIWELPLNQFLVNVSNRYARDEMKIFSTIISTDYWVSV